MSYRVLFVTALATALTATAACHDKEKYLPASPDHPNGTSVDTILLVTPSPTTVPADGLSRTKITAHIDPTATARKISFSTTLGTLVGGGKTITGQAGTLDVDADSAGNAAVELQSVAQVATARVTASIKPSETAAAIVRTLDVPFVAVTTDQVLTLTSSAPSMPADGFSTATITAQLAFNGDRQQNVTFSTSRGTLVRFGAGAGDVGTTVQADASGVARIQLRSDTTVGLARVAAKMGGFEKETFVEFTPINSSDFLSVRPDVDTAPADGFTRVRIVARVSPLIPDSGNNRTVTFTTTDGTFTSNTTPGTSDKVATVKADAGNLAIVELKSPTLPVTAGITATVMNVTARTSVTFTRALPETVFVEATKSTVALTGDTVDLTATLLRDVGQPTSNLVVTWEARDAGGTLIGAFSKVTLATPDPADSTGKRVKATATFDPVDTAAAGAATITATVAGVSGKITIVLR
jgi:hypothetical protein